MAAIWLEGIGITALAVALKDAGPEAIAKAKIVVKKAKEDTVERAQLICPVDTGALKGSIGGDIDGDGLGFEAGPTMEYAPYVEYGTRKMAPQAFMGPAFDYIAAEVQPMLEQIADGIL